MVMNHSTITGPNSRPTRSRAVLLDREDADENHDGDRDDIRIDQRRRDRQPLDRAEHGDRRA